MGAGPAIGWRIELEPDFMPGPFCPVFAAGQRPVDAGRRYFQRIFGIDRVGCFERQVERATDFGALAQRQLPGGAIFGHYLQRHVAGFAGQLDAHQCITQVGDHGGDDGVKRRSKVGNGQKWSRIQMWQRQHR